MTLKKRHIIQLTLLAIISTFVACTSAPEKEQAEDVDIIDISKMPSMVGDSIHTLVSESGRLTYRMIAPKLAIYDKAEEPYWDFPEGIQMITYNEEGGIDGDIKSKLAIYNVKTEIWELRDEVIAVNPDGTKLETELLYWDQEKELIYSDEKVKIIEDGMITLGTGFQSDQSFENWHMDNFSTDFIMDE